MQIYKIDIDYLKYLHTFDNRVQYNPNYDDNKNQNRPYLGVLLNVNGCDYFAPLEHPRESHKTLKNNLQIFKIKEGKLGIIGLNNMIPVPQQALIKFDINKDSNSKILISQYIECKKHWSNIQSRANKVYQRRVVLQKKFEKKICCDFALLEQKSLEYNKTQSQNQSLTAKIKAAQKIAQQQNANKPKVKNKNKSKGQDK